MDVLSAWVSNAWCLWKEEGIRYPRTGVTDDCKLTRVSWELSLGPTEEQQVLFTTELALQSY